MGRLTMRRFSALVVVMLSMLMAAAPADAHVPEKKNLGPKAACKRIDKIVTNYDGSDPLDFVEDLLKVSEQTKNKVIRREVAKIFATTTIVVAGGEDDGGVDEGLGNLGEFCGQYL
jgi:hypothetical protein